MSESARRRCISDDSPNLTMMEIAPSAAAAPESNLKLVVVDYLH